MLDLVFYSVVEVLTGLAPNYTTFLVLRALFGIGMGGEWGVGASLAMEKVPPRLRGVLSGLLQEGYAAGNLLAAISYFFLFQRWGWRPLFFLGGLPALLALFVRFRVKESEVWKKSREQSWSGLGRAIVSHWKLFLYLMLLMTMMNFVSHGTQDMYPTFLERQWHFGPSQRSVITGISMIGAIFGGIVMGLLSDRYGRRRVMVGALLGRNPHGSAVGLCAFHGAAGIGRVPDPVHGAGRVGHYSGAFVGAFARFGARISARICVSMRSAGGELGGLHRSGVCQNDELCYCHGAHRGDRFRAGGDRGGGRQGAQGPCVRRRRLSLDYWRGAARSAPEFLR